MIDDAVLDDGPLVPILSEAEAAATAPLAAALWPILEDALKGVVHDDNVRDAATYIIQDLIADYGSTVAACFHLVANRDSARLAVGGFTLPFHPSKDATESLLLDCLREAVAFALDYFDCVEFADDTVAMAIVEHADELAPLFVALSHAETEATL